MLNTTKQQIETGTGEGGELLGINVCFELNDHRNQQYSVTAITNSSAGVVERYAYQAYGEPTILDASATVLSSSSINNRYTYTGREWDGTIGLYHFRARWMSGLTGRFLTRDPIGFEDGWSLYSDFFFLSGTDPDGESVHSCSSSELKFEQGVKDTSHGGTTGFQGLAEKLGKLLKVSGLSVYWDFQVSGYMRRKDCTEDCECSRSAPYSQVDAGAKGTILFGFSIPVGPNPLLTVKGDISFNADMTINMENGGCAGIRKTQFCGSFSGGGQIKLCAGKKLFGEVCVGVKISCNIVGKCGAVNGGGTSPSQGKCTATVFGGACFANGWLCGETDIGNVNFNLPFM